MTMHGWMLSGATIAVATALGLGLGAYVTSPQSAAIPDDADATYATPIESHETNSIVQTTDDAPRIIRCKGCGPTLAQRQMAADMSGLDADGMITGTHDPVVQDYIAAGDAPPTTPTALPSQERSAPPAVAATLSGHIP